MTEVSEWFSDPTTLLEELQRGRRHTARIPDIPGYDELGEWRRGGQGIVYMARQRSTKRQVAIKVLYDDALPTAARRRRFEREIELVAGLQHPHIVRVYDSGVTTDDRLFFVMEFIEGGSLDEYVRNIETSKRRTLDTSRQGRAVETSEPRSIEAILRLYTKICDAVGYAHLHGVIHRDLKPSNIRIDTAGQPHVLDFGVAKLEANSTSLGNPRSAIDIRQSEINNCPTLTGHFLGTLAYASPEQLRADPARVDVRTDVYSLGVMLYELLTGTPPYSVSGPLSEVMRAVMEEEPPPPSQRIAEAKRNALGARPRVPEHIDDELDTIVLKSLAKDPERRYSSAEALGRDIDRYLAGEPIDAKRDSGWYVLRKSLRRHRFGAAATGGFLLTLLVFGAAMSMLYRRSALEAAKAEQIKVFLEDTLGGVEPTRMGAEVTVHEMLDQAVHWVGSTLAGQPEIAAAIRTTIGNSYRSLGLWEQAEAQMSQALETRLNLFGEKNVAVAHSLNILGLLSLDRGEFPEAESKIRAALDMRRELLGVEHAEVSASLQNLAKVLHLRGDAVGAEQALRESLAIRQRLYGLEHPDVAMGQFRLAEELRGLGRYDEAEGLHTAALAARRKLLHRDHPDVIHSLLALARLQAETGNVPRAVSFLNEGIELMRASRTPNAVQLAEAEALLAECGGDLKKTPEP